MHPMKFVIFVIAIAAIAAAQEEFGEDEDSDKNSRWLDFSKLQSQIDKLKETVQKKVDDGMAKIEKIKNQLDAKQTEAKETLEKAMENGINIAIDVKDKLLENPSTTPEADVEN